MPEAPQINSNYGYPILTEYGVEVDGSTEIIYDDRDDIDNFYSLNNGETWIKYEGTFTALSGTIRAKSVKKESGLEIETSKDVGMPADAIGPEAYDGEDNTADFTEGTQTKYMNVDQSMWGKNARIYIGSYVNSGMNNYTYVEFLNEQGGTIDKISLSSRHEPAKLDKNYEIKEGTTKIKVYNNKGIVTGYCYEIEAGNEPNIVAEQVYPLLTDYGVEKSFNKVTIDYYPTSVEKLYKIDDGDWTEYKGETIRLEIGQTIYAKGIDKNGEETRVISSYTAVMPTDAIGPEAYDGEDNTADFTDETQIKYMNVDQSMWGKTVRFYIGSYVRTSSGHRTYIEFLNDSEEVLDQFSVRSYYKIDKLDQEYVIKEGTTKIKIYNNKLNITGYCYEIEAGNEPNIVSEQVYPNLTEYGVEKSFNNITINYYPTSVEKLYKIDDGDWTEYKGETIRLEIGETIYAKGIDKDGNETRVISSYTAVILADAIGAAAYDGNESTYYSNTGTSANRYMEIDPSVRGKQVYIKAYLEHLGAIKVINSSGTETILVQGPANSTLNVAQTYTIPEDAVRLATYRFSSGKSKAYLYEIGFSNEPTFDVESHYPTLTEDGVRAAYSEININYATTSVQKLYKIDDGDWTEYKEETIALESGQTIYAKGIDKNGEETRVISSYTAIEPADAIGSNAYDGEDATAATIGSRKKGYIDIDESAWGKDVRIYIGAYSSSSMQSFSVKILNEAGESLGSGSISSAQFKTKKLDKNFTIKEGATRIVYSSGSGTGYFYEIQLINEP